MSRPLRLITESFPDDPALDTAVSRALLLRVAGGELPETLRLSRPGAMVAFGKRDVLAPGYAAAVRAARERGFEAIERLAGGRAAVFHEGTLSFGYALAERDARAGIQLRFEQAAEVIAGALRGLGVDARVGEVGGEYCPGAHSVNARGRTKLMGVGQRVIAGGAHVGGLVVVTGADRVRDVLLPVYEELELEWDPATAGAVADEVPGTTLDDLEHALRDAFADRFELREAGLDRATLEQARRLAPEHRSP